jgi:UDP:flavonoid glycosyltransferase YjiC (YdhE family)
LRHLVGQLALAGAEVLIEGAEGAAEKFGAELGDVRIGWIPLDVVAPTCDLAVNHGGSAAAMTVMTAGVPQLIIPPNAHTKAIAQALSGFGAALTVRPREQGPGQNPGEVIAAGCREILSTPRYAEQAQALATEIAALPTPCEVVHTLETLAATQADRPGHHVLHPRPRPDESPVPYRTTTGAGRNAAFPARGLRPSSAPGRAGPRWHRTGAADGPVTRTWRKGS